MPKPSPPPPEERAHFEDTVLNISSYSSAHIALQSIIPLTLDRAPLEDIEG
jgi:hypothetical protein